MIQRLREDGKFVYGLTSRSNDSDVPYAWHNHVVQEFLEVNEVQFSPRKDSWRGLYFAADEKVIDGAGSVLSKTSGKAKVINAVMSGIDDEQCKLAVLIDNTLAKLSSAASQIDGHLLGVHYTEAWSLEASSSVMLSWFCDALAKVGVACPA
eukprot:6363776-Amphidinium_carterae.1